VQGALDQVRAQGQKVVAECPFVKAWIGKHPAYADLLAA
jgi:predicted GNAT family acetyltransferase